MKIKENLIRIFTLLFSIMIPLLLVGSVVYVSVIGYTNEQTIEITVKDKYIKQSKDSKYIVVDTNGNAYDSKYIVVDTNGNAYEITDLTFKGKFNSTDIYNQIEIGKTYIITTTGKRIHFFSMYPNINKVEVIEDEK